MQRLFVGEVGFDKPLHKLLIHSIYKNLININHAVEPVRSSFGDMCLLH